jgi:uncharacterized protein DUF1573
MTNPKRAAHARLLRLCAATAALTTAACGDEKPETSRGGDVDFGIVVQGKVLEHTFLVRNDKPARVTITKVSGCQVCSVAPFDSVIPPGKDTPIAIAIDTRSMRGPIAHRLEVALRDSGATTPRSIYFRVRGGVVFPYELTPDNRVYFFGQQGERQQDTVLLTNHREKPLKILGVSSDNPLISAKRFTYEDGRRYRFDVALGPGAPAGRQRARITVRTDSPDLETFVIHVLAVLDRPVEATPRIVNFGMIQLSQVEKSQMLREKTVLVKKYKGKDFKIIRATVDNPMYEVRLEPRADGQSYLVKLALVSKRAKKGKLTGTLTIETNDPAFPKFVLPIVGTLV